MKSLFVSIPTSVPSSTFFFFEIYTNRRLKDIRTHFTSNVLAVLEEPKPNIPYDHHDRRSILRRSMVDEHQEDRSGIMATE